MAKAEKLVGKAEDEEPEGVNPNSFIDVDGFFARSIGCSGWLTMHGLFHFNRTRRFACDFNVCQIEVHRV